MARRSYEQYCTLARTLDLVGERWTLLLVRELMLGPRRFTDLLDGLPGIGRNLLAERLRTLEAAGLLERRSLPRPAASRVYELTDDGWALGPALAALGRWGAERLPKAPREYRFHPGWAMFPLGYMADRDAARGVSETYELTIGDDVFHLRVEDGNVQPRTGPAETPAVRLTMDAGTLRRLFDRELEPLQAFASDAVAVSGEPAAIERCLAILAPD